MDRLTYGRRSFAGLSIAASLIGLIVVPTAVASTQLDEAFAPPGSTCGTSTFLITGAPAGSTFAAPTDGVITSWSYAAAASAPQIKLKVAHPAGGNNFTFLADSSIETTTANSVNTFPARIPVRTGDIIGFYLVTAGHCFRSGGPATGWHGQNYVATDVPVGTTATSTSGDIANTQYDISAVMELDADNDGFGDETQDCLPADPSVHECPVPETTITKGPKAKTKKKTATFEFGASEPGSSFECKLDDGAFGPCISPHTVKVKKGRHTFAVRATAKGQTDPSPATENWKVKKKKRT